MNRYKDNNMNKLTKMYVCGLVLFQDKMEIHHYINYMK